MGSIKQFFGRTEANFGHMVLGFIAATLASVLINQSLNHYSMIESQKIDEVNRFVASSQQFDNALRDYIHTMVVNSPDGDKSKQELIGYISKQYTDLQVAKVYLGPNGMVAADEYSDSLLKLTTDLRHIKTVPDSETFMGELNRTLQLRQLVELSLRKSAHLPVAPEHKA